MLPSSILPSSILPSFILPQSYSHYTYSQLDIRLSVILNHIVYDVSSRQTFDELLKWFKEIDTYCGEGVVKMVVGNKVDKASN